MIRPALIAAALGLAACSPRSAEPVTPHVAVTDAWCKATPNGARTGGCYATFTATTADQLVSITSPVSAGGQVHEMSMDNGLMTMNAVTLALAPGRPEVLVSGERHIMMSGLTQPFEDGATVPLTFTFRHAPAVTVQAPVRPLTSTAAMAMDHGSMGH